MNFARFSKFALLFALAAICALTLAGCGSTDNMALTQGNWSVSATSTSANVVHSFRTGKNAIPNDSNVSFYVGGNLSQSGSHLSGTMHVTGSCLDPSEMVPFTGTVNGVKVTLTSASVEGGVITVLATGTSASSTSSLSGTYSVAGGCDDGDSGTVTATAVAPITGTWSGTISAKCEASTPGCPTATISIALTQASTASSDGSFPLTGNVTYSDSACSLSGTILGSMVYGEFVELQANTVDQGDDTGSFTYGPALLDSASAPANMTSDYAVGEGQCDGDQEILTLTKVQ